MKSPKKSSKKVDKNTLDVIDKIARRLAPKYTFGYYDVEDIAQEGRLIGLEGLEKYKPENGPLENFLSVCIRNGLYNFKRDNFYRPDQPKNKKNIEKWEKKIQAKISILEPANLDGLDEHFPLLTNYLDHLAYEELIVKINEKLPSNLRTDFLRMLANVQISQTRRQKVQEQILKILEELGYETVKIND